MDLETAAPLMVLLAGIRGQQPVVETRALSRHLAAPSGPPWWVVEDTPLPAPAELSELAAAMKL